MDLIGDYGSTDDGSDNGSGSVDDAPPTTMEGGSGEGDSGGTGDVAGDGVVEGGARGTHATDEAANGSAHGGGGGGTFSVSSSSASAAAIPDEVRYYATILNLVS